MENFILMRLNISAPPNAARMRFQNFTFRVDPDAATWLIQNRKIKAID
jgi:hypothetical protein